MGSISESKPFTNPSVIDKRASETPDRPYAIVPLTEDPKDGFKPITYHQTARAINKVAWWLDEHIPRLGKFDAITYIGPNDFRWVLTLIAVQKTGRQQLILNPNNSLEADVKLLTETSCTHILVDSQDSKYAADAQKLLDASSKLSMIEFPTLEDLLKTEAVHHYPYHGPETVEEANKIPLIISHTSGTTGQPKPIVYMVGWQDHVRQHRHFSEHYSELPTFWQTLIGAKGVTTWPMTWGAGFVTMTDFVCAWEHIPVMFPPNAPQPLPISLITDTIKYSGAKVAQLIPYYVKEIAKSPEYRQIIRDANMNVISYAGGILDQASADILAPLVGHLHSVYGSIDIGIVPTFLTERGDGCYVGFSPSIVSFEKVGDEYSRGDEQEDLYELVHKRAADKYTMIQRFKVEDVQELRTNDLFVRHPDPAKPYFWKAVGRKDDLVKNHFLTKTHCSDIENQIDGLPCIQGACFGEHEVENLTKVSYLIVEVDEAETDKAGSVDKLWPTIEKVNATLSDEIKLKKTNIIVTTSEKPLPRLLKGTLNRRAIAGKFQNELKSLM